MDTNNYKTVWMENSSVFLIEQNLLPFKFKIYEAKTYRDTCHAIKTMIVRGAGAIGAAAGYAMAQAFLENNEKSFLTNAKKEIENTRPTAQNLFYATNRVFDSAINSKIPRESAVREAQKIAEEDAESCRKIGEYGNDLIKDNDGIETHCNAGGLAFADYQTGGTALAPMFEAKRKGKNIFVYADETRPRGQGARLTAWELKNENIPHAIVPDNAGAYLMSLGKINLMIVGADRIAKNGDTANKIGTLEKAIIAKEYNIPFYVAAPTSTFDLNCNSGKDIPIEIRNQEEILFQTGTDKYGFIKKILVCSPGSSAINPSFDITPAKYISGIITEKGIIKPEENIITRLF